VRIAISGYYGAGNLGDEALLAGLLHGLAGSGHTDVTVLSANPGATQRAHGVHAAHRLHGAPLALWRAQAVVSGGGGLLQDVTSGRSLRYYLGVIRFARALGRRVVVYGQSLGPLSQEGRLAVRAALEGVPVGLRDAPSVALAAELGLEAVRVGDAALLLEVPAARRRDTVVLVPRGGFPRVTSLLAEVAQAAAAAGHAVEAAAFHPAVDGPEVARLRAAVPSLRVLDSVDAVAVAGRLSGSRLVVSARLHGLVLAAAGSAPHAGLSYDPKVEGFAQETGAPCWRVPADDDEQAQVLRSILAVLIDPPLDAARLAAARTRARAGIDWLAGALTAA
jgi:polysaccharide pyruvyl transferase CsaB